MKIKCGWERNKKEREYEEEIKWEIKLISLKVL